MQLQRERRRDPYPWTWEVPAAAAITLTLLLLVGVQLGRSVANLVAGAGWTWPHTAAPAVDSTRGGGGLPAPPSPIDSATWSSIPGVLGGDSAAGLPSAHTGGDLAGPALVWTSTALVEVLLVTGLTWALVAGYHRWGPGRMRGMATREQAESLLGLRRLRKVAPLVRPDLHATSTRHPRQVLRAASSDTTHPPPLDPTR